jgi:uncharacterized protein (TIGR03435 family)
MATLVEELTRNLRAPIADRTGLKGEFDLVLEVAPPLDAEDVDPQPRIMEAVRRLGLGLKKGTVAVDVVVVDSVLKAPTPN